MKVNIGKYPRKSTTQRKISVQIDDFDTWSLDHTLALIIHPALVKFKEDSKETGHPCLGIDMDSCTSGSCDCNATWQEMLDKMIWSFEQIVTDEIHEHRDEYPDYLARVKEGLELFGKYYLALWT